MNKIKQIKKTNENYRKYHIYGRPNYIKRPKNYVRFNAHNSKQHEMVKASVCYDILSKGHEFITEACENSTGKIRDIVDITNNEIIEIETTKARASRHGSNITVKMV